VQRPGELWQFLVQELVLWLQEKQQSKLVWLSSVVTVWSDGLVWLPHRQELWVQPLAYELQVRPS